MIPGFYLMFVAVYDDKHMVGGTEIGANFLRQLGSHIPYSFLGYISGTWLYIIFYYDLLC